MSVNGSDWSEFPVRGGPVQTRIIFNGTNDVRCVHLHSTTVELLRVQQAQTTGSRMCISIFNSGL